MGEEKQEKGQGLKFSTGAALGVKSPGFSR
jgi:hypothetical protein